MAGKTAGRMTTPRIALAGSPKEVRKLSDTGIARARRTLSSILATKGPRTVANTLVPYDEILRSVYEVAQQGELVFNTHPDEKVRDAGNEAYQAAMSFLAELNLNRPLFEAFARLRVSGEGTETRHAVSKILRDFRRAGVDKDEATRARLKALNEEITAIGSTFDRRITN